MFPIKEYVDALGKNDSCREGIVCQKTNLLN